MQFDWFVKKSFTYFKQFDWLVIMAYFLKQFDWLVKSSTCFMQFDRLVIMFDSFKAI